MKSDNRYLLPIPSNALMKIDKTTSPMHVGQLRNSIDFVAEVGTPVLAGADGIVTFAKADSYTGGPSMGYLRDSNFVVIRHANGEYTRYDHLAYKSVVVRSGHYVKAGQVIARVGTTGFTYSPHLHFQVFIFTGPNIWMDFETLVIDEFHDNE